MYVTLRPYLNYFLEKMCTHFTIVLFTSATQEYAEEIRDLIDPDGKFIRAVLSRKHCVETANKVDRSHKKLTKDLSVIQNADIERIFIVDDSITNFVNHLAQGIPIIPFVGDSQDEELKTLSEYLCSLARAQDPCRFNSNYFSLHRLKHKEDILTGFVAWLSKF